MYQILRRVTLVARQPGPSMQRSVGGRAPSSYAQYSGHATWVALALWVGACGGAHGGNDTSSSVASTPQTSSTGRAIVALAVAERRERMQRVLDAFRSEGHVPGAVLAASFGDGALVVVASGEADRDQHTPMPLDARMPAGSVTKTFFAGRALQLVGEGKLSLDMPIATYLSDRSWIQRVPNANRATVRMLLNHTSGYPEECQRYNEAVEADPLRARDHSELLECLFDTRPLAEPGARFFYSGLNYDLLGAIEEAVTHDSSAADLERSLFVPLHLTQTTLAENPTIPGIVPGYASLNGDAAPSILQNGVLPFNPVAYWGSASAVSSAANRARWIRAYCTGQVFPMRLWPDVVRSVPAPSPFAPGRRRGLGIEIDSEPTGRTFGHGGLFPGYRTEIRYYADLDLALAIQVNTGGDIPGWRREPLASVARALATPPPKPRNH